MFNTLDTFQGWDSRDVTRGKQSKGTMSLEVAATRSQAQTCNGTAGAKQLGAGFPNISASMYTLRKKCFQAPFLVFQIVTNRGLHSVS